MTLAHHSTTLTRPFAALTRPFAALARPFMALARLPSAATLCSLLWVALLTGCGSPITSPGMPPELKHSWEVSFNRGDSAAIAALYSDQAELVMSNAAPVKGKAAIRAEVDHMIQSGVKVKIGAAQNIGSGDLAYVYGPYSVLDPNGHVAEAGTYVEIWRRRAGAWQIDLDVNSVGAPPQ